jgi:hypothetical protein
MRARLGLATAVVFVAGCAPSIGAPSPAVSPHPIESLMANATPAVSLPGAPATVGPLPSPWSVGQSDLDYPGGPSEFVAERLNTSASEVAAKVYLFDQPSSRGLLALVFRLSGTSSQDAISRLVATDGTCSAPETLTLAGLPAVSVKGQGTETCYVDYLVQLDTSTAAWIIDDGGFRGIPGPGDPTMSPIRYLKPSEVEAVVGWLHSSLPSIVLDQPGPSPS